MDRAFGLVDLMMDKHSTPALPRFPLLQPDMPSGAKSGLTASKTASTNGLPTKGSRTGHNDTDPATRTPVPKAPERGSPHCDSATAAGGSGLRSSEGDGGGGG